MSRPTGRPQVCIRCRQLIGVNPTTCPYCGTRQNSAGGAVFKLMKEDLVEALIIITVAVYVLHLGLTFLVDRDALFNPASFFDIGGPSPRVAILAGGTWGGAMQMGQVWTLVSASFVHLSLLHIGFNMMWLSSLGRVATALWGTPRFLVVFTLTGIGGFALSNLAWGGPTAGASCALFGLMGALGTFGYRRGGTVGDQIKANMVRWVVLATLLSFGIGGVNHHGHAGGLFVGIALGFWLPKVEHAPTTPLVEWAGLGCILVNLGSIAAALLTWFALSSQFVGGA